MQIESPKLGLFTRAKLAWFRFMRWVLHLWVKAKILPEPFDDLVIDRDKPICFVIDSYSLTTLLILDKACEDRGLPRVQRHRRAVARRPEGQPVEVLAGRAIVGVPATLLEYAVRSVITCSLFTCLQVSPPSSVI